MINWWMNEYSKHKITREMVQTDSSTPYNHTIPNRKGLHTTSVSTSFSQKQESEAAVDTGLLPIFNRQVIMNLNLSQHIQ